MSASPLAPFSTIIPQRLGEKLEQGFHHDAPPMYHKNPYKPCCMVRFHTSPIRDANP